MTAFARKSQEANWGAITWEIRTVNHRYLEISIRMPESLRNYEKLVREQIQKSISRGKVEATLKFQPGQDVPFNITVNQSLAQQLADAAQSVNGLFPNAQVNMVELLAWPGILQTKDTNLDAAGEGTLELLQQTLSDLVAARQREGDGVKKFIVERLQNIQQGIEVIKKRMPTVVKTGQTKMKARFEELSVNLDKERFEQEMVWLAQKVDIAEELQRLEAHVIEVQRVLKAGDVVGRRLDFLMQELNREANTISSKSVDSEVTQAAIELRVQIEQMREQVQNIE
ncbi:YicC/YloC family endoribonuclease [Candidiatus Paracoxiella cheracis]|uniref:YicC/YloC family endoribonuclease n=1 Tax=Candidiatus Paracoxiella cheracis TaxID=3405120 RepID=UPI003BF61E91